jgi:AraC-like DNA-binding protein/mannose-6-phosphate isomerase-like protein (cupin superfamily)
MSTTRYDLTSNTKDEIKSISKLLYVSSAKFGIDWHSTPHTHNCSELFYVTSGMGQFQIEDRIYPVSENDLVIINPNVIHTEISLNSNPMEYIVVGADGLEFDNNNTDDAFRIINCQNFHNKIHFYMNQMLKEIESKALGYETVCQNLMDILVITLFRQTNFSMSLTPVKKNSTRLCKIIRRYIDTHYKESITLETLMELTHVSKYYLIHTFTKEYGISPINYMIACRIEEAKQLLKNDDYTISFISRTLGFSSQSYFSQTFKKATGLSPNGYRKKSHL